MKTTVPVTVKKCEECPQLIKWTLKSYSWSCGANKTMKIKDISIIQKWCPFLPNYED